LHGSGDRLISFEWKSRGGTIWKHSGKWEGIVPQLLSSFKKTASGPWRLALEKYMRAILCPTCRGQRLNAQARAVQVGGRTIVEIGALPISKLTEWIAPNGPLERSLEPIQQAIAAELLKEIRGRVAFLMNVGLHYLSLDRSAPSLSGGEAQRIRLAGQIGCGLVGVLYILDEPSIGLHPRDNDQLLRSLERLRDLGNTVLVVEHDEETMRVADYVVDFGPGPGIRGGEVVAAGTYADIVADAKSLTGRYLSGAEKIPVPVERRSGNGAKLTIVGARRHNLKNLTVEVPLGKFVGVTGVSGSGKSSLVNDILLEGLSAANDSAQDIDNGDESADADPDQVVSGAFDRIDGREHIDKVIAIDQSPIGRTPRSNPATYIKVFDEIRAVFAQVSEAKVRGYSPSRVRF
jgi:excinuclease ABC subunit A